MSSADDLKERGNAAFKEKRYEEAATLFSEAIGFDGTNHVLYSNRSACFVNLKRYEEALRDAENVVNLKPDWPRGWMRKADSLFGMGNYSAAKTAYEKAQSLDPQNASIQTQINECESRLQDSDPMGGFSLGDCFRDPNVFANIAASPQLSSFLGQPDYMNIIAELHRDPSKVNIYMKDQRILQTMLVLMGLGKIVDNRQPFDQGMPNPYSASKPSWESSSSSSKAPKPETSTAAAAAAAPMDVDEELSEEERELRERKTQAAQCKQEGNEYFHHKEYDLALERYLRARELDPEEIVYRLNVSAVYLAQERYDECIRESEETIEAARAQFADFKHVAKAFFRIGSCYEAMDRLEDALKAYENSFLENRSKEALNKKNELEREIRRRAEAAYISPEISLQHKERGNALFKESKFPEAVEEYTEAIKRNPTDHVLYSNRAAAYIKLAALPHALKDCEKCIELDSSFVRGWSRKGQIHLAMKEYHKAREAYEKALQLDPNFPDAKEGYNKTMIAIQGNMGNRDPERVRRAMEDPEIQAIMSDQAMHQILQDIQTDPKAAREHLSNPLVQEKLQKLIEAGVLVLGGPQEPM